MDKYECWMAGPQCGRREVHVSRGLLFYILLWIYIL